MVELKLGYDNKTVSNLSAIYFYIITFMFKCFPQFLPRNAL